MSVYDGSEGMTNVYLGTRVKASDILQVARLQVDKNFIAHLLHNINSCLDLHRDYAWQDEGGIVCTTP